METLGFTPELSTCETISAIDPADEWDPEACESGFNFPDDEALIEAEFDVSYGSSQSVAVDVKRDVKSLKLFYRINGGKWRSTSRSEWKGGERYGDTGDTWFAERRGKVRGARVGDVVEVKFVGVKTRRGDSGRNSRVESESFTYTVASTSRADVLIVANEAYTGVNPVQGVTAPVYASTYAEALDESDISYEIWDVDAQGVPHDLSGGVGVFVDDTRLVVDGTTTAEGFESGSLGAWVAGGPPAGSPPASGEFVAAQQLIQVGAVIVTSDSALLRFGIERLEDPATRAAVVGELITSLTAAP